MKVPKAILILCFLLPFLLPGEDPPKKEKIRIDARKKVARSEEVIEFSDEVSVRFGDYRFFGSFVRFNQKERTIEAPGRSTLSTNKNIMSGDDLYFDIRARRGKMENVSGELVPRLFYRAGEIRQVDGENIDFNQFWLSSCNDPVPLWSIRCREGRIARGDYIRMKHVVFRVKNVPVFYLPAMKYPVRQDGRATGFLFPQLGTSAERGFYISNQFFWNIRPDLDLTLGVDYFSLVGRGGSAEMRWKFPRFQGDIRVYGMFYKMEDDRNFLGKEDDVGFLFNATVRKDFEFLDTRVTVNIDRQSSPDFLRVFSKQFASQLRATFNSSIGLKSTLTESTYLTVDLSERKTFIPSGNYSSTYQVLPQVGLTMRRQKVRGLPGYFSFHAGFSNTRRTGESYLDEGLVLNRGESKPRFTVTPGYTLDLLSLPWFSTTVSLEGDYAYEMKSIDSLSGQVVPEGILTTSNKMTVNIKGPSFYRNYPARRADYRHLVETEVTYRLAAVSDNMDRVIRASAWDFPDFSYLSFRLSTSIVRRGKGKTESTDVLDYTIDQTYYFDPALASRNRKVAGEYPQFSELSQGIRFRPWEKLEMNAGVKYNHYLKEVTKINCGISLDFSREVSGGIHFNRYRNEFVAADWFFNRSYIGGNLNFRPPWSPLDLVANINYDLTDGQFQFGNILATVKLQCMRINGQILVRRGMDGKVLFEPTVGISLGNLGGVKDFFQGDL